jgi:hypothetical protein
MAMKDTLASGLHRRPRFISHLSNSTRGTSDDCRPVSIILRAPMLSNAAYRL